MRNLEAEEDLFIFRRMDGNSAADEIAEELSRTFSDTYSRMGA